MAAKKNTSAAKSNTVKIKLDDTVSLLVNSNVFGELIYRNLKTGDEYRWKNMGDVQSLYVSDIRAMKFSQKRFLEENWLLISGFENPDEEQETLKIQDIYEALQISQYYKPALTKEDLDRIFTWSKEEVRQKLSNLSPTMKETIIIRANELIQEGTLDSISKVHVLEEVLNTELASSQP